MEKIVGIFGSKVIYCPEIIHRTTLKLKEKIDFGTKKFVVMAEGDFGDITTQAMKYLLLDNKDVVFEMLGDSETNFRYLLEVCDEILYYVVPNIKCDASVRVEEVEKTGKPATNLFVEYDNETYILGTNRRYT